jgi:hypothetical protein
MCRPVAGSACRHSPSRNALSGNVLVNLLIHKIKTGIGINDYGCHILRHALTLLLDSNNRDQSHVRMKLAR